MEFPTYVLITAARDEADNIGRLIESVCKQTVLPRKWIIVSDNSTDATDDIVTRAAAQHDWIELLRRGKNEERNFSSKTQSIEMAFDQLRPLPFDILAIMDADISIPPDYVEFLLSKLAAMPRLGVTGTPYVEEGFDSRTGTNADPRHVSGGCQLFRRACWEEMGGYLHIKEGGEDWAAVRIARLKGWETRAWADRAFFHHRRIATGGANVWKGRMHYGKRDYLQGNSVAWELGRALFHMKNRPYVLGGALMFAGYVTAWLRREKSPLPREIIALNRADQRARMRAFICRHANANKPAKGEGEKLT